MTTRRFKPPLLIILLTALSLWAGDPWKDKPYTEWTAKENERILTKSPWAKKADVLLGWYSVPVYDFKNADLFPCGASVPDPMRPCYQTAPNTTPVVVQWISSRTVRQASARQKQLEGGSAAVDEARPLTDKPDYYAMLIRPLSMINLSAGSIRLSTFLEINPGSRKMPVSKVLLSSVKERIGNYEVDVVQAIELRFPRQVDGKPTIEPTDQQAVLRCAIGEDVFRVKFDLRKMVRDGKPDL